MFPSSLDSGCISYLIVPKGRIEDPPAPKIKIFSSAPAAGGCLPPLQHISALQHTFSRIFAKINIKSIFSTITPVLQPFNPLN